LEAAANETVIRVSDGKHVQQKTVSKDEIKVEGQSAGGWVLLGALELERGRSAYVEITNTGAGGLVAADAVLFVPEKKH